jgi:hypothetical protein
MPFLAALTDVAGGHACARASVWFRAARTRSAASMLLVALLASLNYLVGIGEPRHAV